MGANTATFTQVHPMRCTLTRSDLHVMMHVSYIFYVCFFLLQNGTSGIWRGMRLLSFVGSTLYFTMTSQWSTLEPRETALRSKESMYHFHILSVVWLQILSYFLSKYNSIFSFVSPVRVLSKDSPSGEMKAVVRECTVQGKDKQFLEVCVWLSVTPALYLSLFHFSVLFPLLW